MAWDEWEQLKAGAAQRHSERMRIDHTAALDEILSTWEKRLTSVRHECDRLHGALGKTGRDFGEIDPAVAGEVNKVHVGDKPDWARRGERAHLAAVA